MDRWITALLTPSYHKAGDIIRLTGSRCPSDSVKELKETHTTALANTCLLFAACFMLWLCCESLHGSSNTVLMAQALSTGTMIFDPPPTNSTPLTDCQKICHRSLCWQPLPNTRFGGGAFGNCMRYNQFFNLCIYTLFWELTYR